jgi:ABC-type dipeptide/oligopeptide/nickel transport system permease component
MYLILKEAHNKVGLIILFFLLAIILFMIVRFLLKKPFDRQARVVSLVGLTIVHIQFSLGILMYFLSPLGLDNFSGASMKHPIARFYIVEHPIGMILAIVLITIGNRFSRRKKLSSDKIYKRVILYYTMAFGIIAYLTPWFLWS